ncbi:MAG: twin-arginine translocase TatA/TatE family subunit, partial [Bdellovibrionales bacterium]|nr:twin-arginine translocase TatA/TatE family subunit [Bdellovibrionales bacterium]
GPRRLPDLGASLGRTLRNFKDAMNNDQMPASGDVAPPQTLIPTKSLDAAQASAPTAAPQEERTAPPASV